MHSHLRGHPGIIQAAEALGRLSAQKFELYYYRRSSTRIEARSGKIDALSRADDTGLSIRILRGQRVGFSYTTSLEPAAIRQAVDSAWEIAEFMPDDPHHDLPSFSNTPYPSIDLMDDAGLALSIEEKVQRALQLEADCLKFDPRIQGVRAATLSENRYEMSLVDSSGEQLWQEGTMYSASISCRASSDGDNQMGHASAHSVYLDELAIEPVARRAATRATEKLGAGTTSSRRGPSIFRSEAMIQLVSFLSGSFSAEQVDKNRSMLAGRRGERLFSERIQLDDDGLMPGGVASSPFDGEGTASRKTSLVRNGVIESFLYDRYHARKHGVSSTANAGRGIKAPPSISTTNLVLQPGSTSRDELIARLGQGVMVTDLMGVHTANPVTGDFSLGASGFLIENGRIGRPIRGFAVAGNILELFRNVVELGDDLEFMGSVGAPSALVGELSIGGN